MDPTLAGWEFRIAAKWWRDLLVRRHDQAYQADLFRPIAEHSPMHPEQADAFQAALVTEIQDTFGVDLILWDAAVPSCGAGRRKLEVVGTRASSVVVRAADSAGLAHVLPYLSDGTMTAIHPGQVFSHEGRPAVRETSKVAALHRGGAS